MPGDADMVKAMLGSKPPEQDDGGQSDEGLHSAAEDLISAVHGKDAAGVVDALRNAFTMLDAEPHDEGGEPPNE